MPRIVALEWDSNEARLAVGRDTGNKMVIEDLQSFDWSENPPRSADEVGRQLAGWLQQLGLARCEARIAIPRGKAELRVLETPPAPDDELPDLVRFQALRQFSTLGEDWPLDFVRLDTTTNGPPRVLAAAVSPALCAEYRQICTDCELLLTKLVLRPFATATLYMRQRPASGCRLLVEHQTDEMDLTVLADGQVVFLRSVRLPQHDTAATVSAEIRRTLIAAQNQLQDRTIDAATLVGNADELESLRATLEADIDLPTDIFDPAQAAAADIVIRDGQTPENLARFAALLGMLLVPAHSGHEGIDFANPRRRPAAPKRGRRYALLGVVASVALVVLITMVWWNLGRYDRQLKALQAESKSLDEQVKLAQQLKVDVAEIDKFAAANINWLDEMYTLSSDFPDADQAIIDQATFAAIANGGGQITLEGYVSEPSVIESMENGLRDARHQVAGGGAQFDERQKDFRWGFKETVVVAPPSNEVDDTAATEPEDQESTES